MAPKSKQKKKDPNQPTKEDKEVVVEAEEATEDSDVDLEGRDITVFV